MLLPVEIIVLGWGPETRGPVLREEVCSHFQIPGMAEEAW